MSQLLRPWDLVVDRTGAYGIVTSVDRQAVFYGNGLEAYLDAEDWRQLQIEPLRLDTPGVATNFIGLANSLLFTSAHPQVKFADQYECPCLIPAPGMTAVDVMVACQQIGAVWDNDPEGREYVIEFRPDVGPELWTEASVRGTIRKRTQPKETSPCKS